MSRYSIAKADKYLAALDIAAKAVAAFGAAVFVGWLISAIQTAYISVAIGGF